MIFIKLLLIVLLVSSAYSYGQCPEEEVCLKRGHCPKGRKVTELESGSKYSCGRDSTTEGYLCCDLYVKADYAEMARQQAMAAAGIPPEPEPTCPLHEHDCALKNAGSYLQHHSKSIFGRKDEPSSAATVNTHRSTALYIPDKQKFDDWKQKPCGEALFSGHPKIYAPNADSVAKEGDHPWHVAIIHVTDGKAIYRCGGVLITEHLALTVAHCLVVGSHQYILKPSELKVRVGDYDLLKDTEHYIPYDVSVNFIKIHPEYDLAKKRADLAVLELAYSLKGLPNVRPICLPDDVNEENVDRSRCKVAGWGQTFRSSKELRPGQIPFSTVLREAGFYILHRLACQSNLRRVKDLGPFYKLPSHLICAKGYASADTCEGDGGSALVCPNNDGRYVLQGLVTHGVGCGHLIPGLYSDISQYMHFVRNYKSSYYNSTQFQPSPPSGSYGSHYAPQVHEEVQFQVPEDHYAVSRVTDFAGFHGDQENENTDGYYSSNQNPDHGNHNNHHPDSNYQHPDSNYQHPDSNYQNPDSNYQNPDSNYQHPDSNYQNPDNNYQHPDSNYQHPDSNYQHPDSNYQHPDNNYQNPDSNYQNPDSNSHNPDSNYQHPDNNYQHPDNNYQHPDNNYQHPDVNYQHPDGNYQHPDNTYQHPDNTYQHPDNTYQHPDNTYQHPDNTYQHPDNTYQHPDNTYQHPNNNYQQPGTNYQNPDGNYQQPGTNYQQPGTNYQQPGTNYQQPGTNYQNPDSNYQDPGENYQYTDNDYHRPTFMQPEYAENVHYMENYNNYDTTYPTQPPNHVIYDYEQINSNTFNQGTYDGQFIVNSGENYGSGSLYPSHQQPILQYTTTAGSYVRPSYEIQQINVHSNPMDNLYPPHSQNSQGNSGYQDVQLLPAQQYGTATYGAGSHNRPVGGSQYSTHQYDLYPQQQTTGYSVETTNYDSNIPYSLQYPDILEAELRDTGYPYQFNNPGTGNYNRPFYPLRDTPPRYQ